LNIVENAAIAYQDGYLDRRSVIEVGGNDEISRLARAFNKLFGQMQETLFNLEDRVRERTASLAAATIESERRAKQFEAITLVGSAISSIRSLEDLLPKITELISQQFSYYHVGIFLNDANNENAILSAANSEGGKQMLLRGHQLKIGEQGIVGYAISTGNPRIALDVGEDAVYFGNPELSNTRSEMALPLKIGKDVVGALDVQSTEASAFGEEDISVLSLLADQVSMAIENARLFDQARKSLAESEALYRQYLRQAWNRLPKEQNLAGFRYNARGASPIETKLQANVITYNQEATEEIKSPCISVPIAIRGETIGTLSVQIPDEKNINENQMDLVNAVAERVALSAENARLFEETTRRAERERLVSDITVKIRSSNDPDTMIKIALEELKQALGASKVQLVPHTLQKSGTNQQSEIPTSRPIGNPTRKNVER
jgi:GAF domain-containing protein